jgi:excinuclease ABC subunit A
LFTFIRDLFRDDAEAKARGYRAGRFSFNIKGGRCEACQGDGMIAIEMHFLPDVYVTCEQCKGRRYNRETLDILYRASRSRTCSISRWIRRCRFWRTCRDCQQAADTAGCGPGYIELGQSATTLSGGEAQRVKLAKELSKRGTGRTLYILDEPTTGLHSKTPGSCSTC